MSCKSAKRQQIRAFRSLWTDFIMSPIYKEKKMNTESWAGTEVVEYMISPAGRGAFEVSPAVRAAYERLQIGMSDADVLEILDAFILEDGDLRDMSDPRLCRFYFQVGVNAQFWLEFTFTDAMWLLVRKSPLEAKCEWHRYADNQISLPLTMDC